MTERSGQVIALEGSATALGQGVAQTLTQQGAHILKLTPADDPSAFASAHPDINTLVLFLPALPTAATLDVNDNDWELAVTANLTRCFRLIKAFGANMLVRRNGLILLVGGLTGLTGFPGWAASSALEGALIAFTRSLAVEWAEQQVRLVYLACGAVEGTPAYPATAPVAAHTALERTPLKRLATSDDIARTIQYLLSDRATFFTGSVIRADGGWTSWGLLK